MALYIPYDEPPEVTEERGPESCPECQDIPCLCFHDETSAEPVILSDEWAKEWGLLYSFPPDSCE